MRTSRIFNSLIQAKQERMYRHRLYNDGVIVTEGEDPRIGTPVFGLSEDKEERFPAPEGHHELEDGRVMKVDKNRLFAGWLSEKAVEMRKHMMLTGGKYNKAKEAVRMFELRMKNERNER